MNPQNSLLPRRQAYMGGAWRDADNGAPLAVRNPVRNPARNPLRNPFDASVLATAPDPGQAATARAIAAADGALPALPAPRAGTRKSPPAIA